MNINPARAIQPQEPTPTQPNLSPQLAQSYSPMVKMLMLRHGIGGMPGAQLASNPMPGQRQVPGGQVQQQHLATGGSVAGDHYDPNTDPENASFTDYDKAPGSLKDELNPGMSNLQVRSALAAMAAAGADPTFKDPDSLAFYKSIAGNKALLPIEGQAQDEVNNTHGTGAAATTAAQPAPAAPPDKSGGVINDIGNTVGDVFNDIGSGIDSTGIGDVANSVGDNIGNFFGF